MKKFLLLTFSIVLLGIMNGWGQILTFEFSGLTGSETTASSNSNDVNISSSTISRGAGLTASNNGDRFNATSWALSDISSAVSGNDYMEFTITPGSGYLFSVSSIYIQLQRSSTGPRGIAIRSSADNYTSNLDQEYSISDVTSTQTFTFNFSQVNSTSPVTYRIYMWAESTGGSGGIGDGSGNDIIVNGSVSSSGSGPDNPTAFTATTASTSQIDLSWTQNGSSDDVMVVFDTDGSFTDPVDGNTYSVSSSACGGTVIYNGSAGSFNHTSLNANTQYFYKAWSVDGSDNYSSGVSDDATTQATEPSNHPTLFSATANSSSQITISWTDAGSTESYLIKGSDVAYASIVDPVDGTEEANSTLVQNVAQGVGTHQFTGLSASTTYYFQIYPFNGSGATINYKTDGSIPQATATTQAAAAAPDFFISELADPGDNYQARFIELFNNTGATIDFSSSTWYLCRQTNGGSWEDEQLTGSLSDQSAYVLANGNTNESDYFYLAFGYLADYDYGGSSGNGDDAYFLYKDGDHTSGTLVDSYGVADTDGTGEAWEYEDSRAIRKLSVTSPNTTWTSSEWVVIAADVADMTPGFYGTSWTGATDNSWSTNGNWDLDVPGGSVNALIKGGVSNDPTLSAAGSCNDLIIKSGASLVGVNNLTVSGTTTVEQDISAYTTSSDGWNLVAFAVSGASVSGSNAVSGNYDLYLYGESTNTWYNQEDVGNAALFTNYAIGSGYLYANDADITLSTSGTLNTSDISISGLTKTTGQGEGFHALGNSFPSGVDFGSCTLTGVNGVAHVLKKDGTGYTTRSAATNDELPANQGFFVEVNSAPGSITIPVSACVHSSESFSAKTNTNDITFRLFIDSLRNTETRLMIHNSATDAFDTEYDAHYLPPFSPDIPNIYTLIGSSEKLALNAFSLNGQKSIPLAMEVSGSGNFEFFADGIESLDNNIGISLEDTYNNTSFDLRQINPLNLSLSDADGNDRFIIHLNNIVMDINQNDEMHLFVYSSGNTLHLSNTSEHTLRTSVEIFSMLGQKVFDRQVELGASLVIPTRLPAAGYIVKVYNENAQTTKKLLITK